MHYPRPMGPDIRRLHDRRGLVQIPARSLRAPPQPTVGDRVLKQVRTTCVSGWVLVNADRADCADKRGTDRKRILKSFLSAPIRLIRPIRVQNLPPSVKAIPNYPPARNEHVGPGAQSQRHQSVGIQIKRGPCLLSCDQRQKLQMIIVRMEYVPPVIVPRVIT